MREDYVPNEKYRNMFGVERNGYGMERVDLYLAQLEVAFKKIREDNRAMKRELTEQGNRQAAAGGSAPPAQESAEAFQRLHMQLAEQRELNSRLQAALAEQNSHPGMQSQTEALMAQITALRGEADELRQRLRQQPAAPYGELCEEDKQQLIGRVLVDARAAAEETLRAARQEADQLLRKSRQRAEELRLEQERIMSQLQGLSYALHNVLREGADADLKRGEDFAVS
ncbi:MAG: hypothetical protein LBQ33_04360 [Oscillospiraceae bacterium]|jgi:small-conductance mechanosensitive channel|nr:hypothetical protein [Oscillospiraceae bacterium]